jgi:hypothetical protein
MGEEAIESDQLFGPFLVFFYAFSGTVLLY